MNPIKQLSEKPWLVTGPEGNSTSLSSAKNWSAAKTALVFFMLVVTVLFFLITITFLSRSQYPDFTALAGAPWLPFSNPITLWVNSALLLIASISMQVAMHRSNESHRMTIITLLSAACFSCLFLVGQLSVWIELTNNGYGVNQNPANSYFYLFTGVHALHLVGGFVVLTRSAAVFIKKNGDSTNESRLRKLKASLRLCAMYWHYLFVVWMLLFALLTASPQTYKTIASLCGF